MPAIDDFLESVRGFLNRRDIPRETLISLVRMGEEELNKSLRIKNMLRIETAVLTENRVLLPGDWLELEVVKIVDGRAMDFVPRDDMFDHPDRYGFGNYTLSGDYLIVGGKIDEVHGRPIELHFIGQVPVLGDDPTWLLEKYPSLYMAATLVMASAFGLEDDKATLWQAKVNADVQILNDAYRKAKASGSRLVRKGVNRSFG